MSVRDILRVVDRLAPFELAEPWDHVGLQVGSPGAAVDGVLVALEADDDALDEAARLGCELVLAHHPLIFSPLERLTEDSTPGRSRCARRATASPSSSRTPTSTRRRGGLGDIFAAMLGLEDTQPLRPRPSTGASSSASCRRTTPTSCARRCSPPAAA